MSSSIAKHFGSVIRSLRKEKSWSQEVLAQETKLHRNYVGAVERGEKNISLKNIEKFAEIFEIPLSKIFQKIETFKN